ncbi:MAG: hypothetical protein V3U74_00955 [Thermodesulfobacteriota bacterium]
MNLEEIPGRVFLDTSALNFILDFGEYIFDGSPKPDELNQRIRNDIDALYNIFLTGQRASWQLAISPFTYTEITNTKDIKRRESLNSWFMDVWYYWLDIVSGYNELPSLEEAECERDKLLSTDILDALPNYEDRILICDALVYKCDCFCTRDWHTILKHRTYLSFLPLKIVTPNEWWKLIEPYSRIWA